MRWLAYIGVVLILIAPAYAALSDSSTLYTEYKKNLGKGACQVTYGTDYNYAPGDKNEGSQAYGFWPSTNNCNQLVKSYTYDSNGEALTVYSASTYTAAKEGVILTAGDWHWYEDKWSGGFHHNWEGFGLGAIDKNNINPVATTTDPIPIFNLAFGGGTFQATYAKTTYLPDTISYTGYATNKENVPDSFASKYGRLPTKRTMWGDQEERWYNSIYSIVPPTGSVNTAYTLPLPQYCTGFKIEARDAGGGQVNAGRKDMDETSSGYSTSIANGPDNTIVDLTVKNGILNKIAVKVNGPNYNQIALTIYCVPGDTDENELACKQAFGDKAWNAIANTDTEKNACCGDDGAADTADKISYGGKYCEQTSTGKYQWSDAAKLCTYPTGWKIGTKTAAELKADAELSYLSGAGCCSDPANFGKAIRISATNEAVCTLTSNNESRWKESSKELFIPAVNPNKNVPLFSYNPTNLSSNGAQWLACGAATSNIIKQAPNAIRTAGSCEQSNACDQTQLDACMYPVLGSQTNDCQDQQYVSDNNYGSTEACCEAQYRCSARAEPASCSTYDGTACNADNMCACPDGQTWSGTACVTYTQCNPGFTYNPTSKLCEGSASAAYTQATVCTQNTKDNSGYICTTQWEVFDKGYKYLFDSKKAYITDQTDEQQMKSVAYFCQDGSMASGALKYTPNKASTGICKTDQCYLGGPTNACIKRDDFVYAAYCASTNENIADWTTRTQYLAEALYNKAGADDFVLHCDEYSESINDKKTAVNQYDRKYINSLCVLSKKDRAEAIGVSLNGNSTGGRGTTDPVLYYTSFETPAFYEILSSTTVKDGETIMYGENACKDAIKSKDPLLFTRCDTTKGSVLYNADKSLLVFSAEDSYTLEQTWFEKFTNWFKTTFTSAQQKPPFITLSGNKIYAAKKGDKQVQAVLQPEYKNKQQAIIVYENIDVSKMCKRYEAKKRATCTPLTAELYKVNITNPTQSEWEAFTLLVRP